MMLDSFGSAFSDAPAKLGKSPVLIFDSPTIASETAQCASKKPVAQDSPLLLSAFFTDSNTGTAMGKNGTILRTIDGSATWTVQSSGTRITLTDVTFSNANAGTAMGENGTILRTTNGGATWTISTCEMAKTLRAYQGNPIELWVSRYNGPANGSDDAVGVAVSPDGSRVFVTGVSGGIGTADDWATVAYDTTTGKQLWVTRLNGPANGDDAPQAAPVVSPDGSRIYVTGSMGVGGINVAMRTVAYDAADGSEIWAASYQGPASMSDSPTALALSPDGSKLFVTGWSEYPSPVFSKYVTIAYDASDGSRLWVSEYHGPGTGDEAYAVAISPSGSRLFVTGGSIGVGTHVDFGTVAYNSDDGSELWVARYNGPGNYQDTGRALGVNADGSRVFVTGESASGATENSFDYATVAYDANDGSQVWVSRYNGPVNDIDLAKKLAVAGNRVFVTGSSTGLAQPLRDFATVAYSTTDGSELWVARYQGADTQSFWDSTPRALGVNADGSRVFVTGPSPGIGTDLDYVTVAYGSSDGEGQWIARYDDPAHAADTASGLAVYGSDVYVTGSIGGTTQNDYGTVAYHVSDSTPTPTPTSTATVTPSLTPNPTPTPTPSSSPTQALNISTRLRVETGENVMIGGFIVTGNAAKNIAVRGIGPSLAAFGISDVLADPILALRDGSGALLFQNDNWQDDPAQAAQLTALGLALQNPTESGIVATLQSGASYTAILAGKNGGTGVGLVEIYDTNQATDSQLANISTRGFVQTGTNVMIGGFILGGGNNTEVVVRGIGPSLAQVGLSNVLADPTLELRNSNGALLISNDNWQDDPTSAAQLTAHGLAPQNSLESGIFSSLPPGAFTAILAGKDGGTGIGLVEIYNVH